MTQNQQLSLYIPLLMLDANQELIKKTFRKQDIGLVESVHFGEKWKNGKMYCCAWVYFTKWYNNPASIHFQERILDKDKEARIIYNDPSYWICVKNILPKTNTTYINELFVETNKNVKLQKLINKMKKQNKKLESYITYLEEKKKENKLKIVILSEELDDLEHDIDYEFI